MNARSKRSGQPKGSDRNFGSKIALAGVALVAGCFCAATSVANAIQKINASAAYTLAPWNAPVESALANQLFTDDPLGVSKTRAGLLARSALMKDPTSAKALTVLGFQAELARDNARRDRIFTYSSLISRRELRSQIWAAENAISSGDISGALHHYDIALRTSGAARTLLFPTLINALSEPLVRQRMLDLLKTKPNWAQMFVNSASMTGPNYEATADFFKAGTAIGLPLDDNMRASVVNGMLAQGKIESAWAYYESFRNGARRDRSRDPLFLHAADVRSGFDWVPSTETGVSAAVLKSGNRGVLEYSLLSGDGGTIVSQRQMLPAGSYRFRGRASPNELPEASRPYWIITCDDGTEVLRLAIPTGTSDYVPFNREFVMPETCPHQTLSLVARHTDTIDGIAGRIEEAAIEPLVAKARQ